MIVPDSVAFIGTRVPTVGEQTYCRRAASYTAQLGKTIRTGRAPGIDAIATDAGLKAGGTVLQFTPWYSFELEHCDPYNPPYWSFDRELPEYRDKLIQIAREFYPPFDTVSRGIQALKARNVAIILGPDLNSWVEAVFAFPKPKFESADMGGTGMGILIARAYGIPVFDFHEDGAADAARDWLMTR